MQRPGCVVRSGGSEFMSYIPNESEVYDLLSTTEENVMEGARQPGGEKVTRSSFANDVVVEADSRGWETTGLAQRAKAFYDGMVIHYPGLCELAPVTPQRRRRRA